MNTTLLARALQILGLLPLLAYPAVLVANAMQAGAFAGQKQRDTDAKTVGMMSFVAGTTLYPLVALLCYARANRAQSQSVAWSAAPLAFLGALVALFAAMDASE